MKFSGKYRYLLFAMIFSIAGGFVFQILYNISPSWSVDKKHFQEVLKLKEKEADSFTDKIISLWEAGKTKQLLKISRQSNGIFVFLEKNNQTVYWTDNHLDINPSEKDSTVGYEFRVCSNAYCIEKITVKDSLKITTVIFLKHNFPYENDVLHNDYAEDFGTSEKIKIAVGKPVDKYAIFNGQGHYLFTLLAADTPVYNNGLAVMAFIFFIISVLLFFICYANINRFTKNRKLSLSAYFVSVLATGVFISFLLWFKKPELLFWDAVFSAQQYAFHPLLSSITHLFIVTLYLLSSSFLFYFNVQTDNKISIPGSVFLQLLSVLYFVVVFIIIRSLIFHSGVQLNIISFREITFVAVWIHFLILLLGVGFTLFFFKVHNLLSAKKQFKTAIYTDLILLLLLAIAFLFVSRGDTLKISIWLTAMMIAFYSAYYFKRSKMFYRLLALWILVYTFCFIVFSILMMNEKKAEKYKLVAQNIMMNGNVENDRITEIMLEELESHLSVDKRLSRMAAFPDSVLSASNYLNKNYLRGYWNKYEMRLNIAPYNSEMYLQFAELIDDSGIKLRDTHFYKIPASKSGLAYLGIFKADKPGADSVFYFMQFFPRRNSGSYSFPGFLLSPVQDLPSNQGISVSKFENDILVYASGEVQMPVECSVFDDPDKDFFVKNIHNRNYYIYTQGKGNHIIISENTQTPLSGYLIYFVYACLFFFALTWLMVQLYLYAFRKKKAVIGFTTRFQYAFIALLIVSFVGIFYVSVNFIRQNYKNEQITKLENKKKYIQKALQNLYYWSQDLTEVNSQALNLDLQELSYLYQTDIHVYNNSGNLIGSSQPLIFNKNLTGTRISPVPYFSERPDLTQYESIGRLRYLVSYTDFYNGDYLQLGFIALPQFLSQEEIQLQITGFLSVIIHIYLIVIFLVIFLSIIIGKQLSAPLILIENKLKMMRFGHRNEKIDYQSNDEIGQLVEQYNRTVDELEKSAKQLAKSERESAWKTMARQIAHEINNPLTPMKLTIQQLQRTYNLDNENFETYFKKSTSILIEQIDNLSRIAATFSNFAKLPEAQFRRVDVAARLNSVVQLFANNHEQTEVIFTGKTEDVFVFADPEQLTQVFNNLLKNAIQAIPESKKGKVIVNLEKSGKEIKIEVIDNGTGITPDVAEKMFTPNFTTKSTGMGLGLAISKSIIEITGGKIIFNPGNETEGAIFTVILPAD